MSFPDLALNPEASLHASAVGVPSNGNNTIKLPFRKTVIDPDKLVVDIYPLGPQILDAELISVDPNTAEMVINFTQMGNDSARVETKIEHSITW